MSIDLDKLESICMPAVEYLRDHGHPHMQIIVTDSHIRATADLAGIPCSSDSRCIVNQDKSKIKVSKS